MADAVTGQPWTTTEIDRVVEAYMNMLKEELAGRRPVKADVVRDLQRRLPARSSRSIEYKLQNISAVLDQQGLQWIDGYKPAAHYQRDLVYPTLDAFRTGHIAEDAEAYATSALAAPAPQRLATEDVMTAAPSMAGTRRRTSPVGLTVGPVGALKDFQNRALGDAGERWVLDLEREQLEREGRRDLADRVQWVSKEVGDGAGYDIGSFLSDGRQVQIEVKTTNYSSRTPFYVSRWEVDVSRQVPASYALYRVYGFAREPRLYVLRGSIEASARLEPRVFLGWPL